MFSLGRWMCKGSRKGCTAKFKQQPSGQRGSAMARNREKVGNSVVERSEHGASSKPWKAF